MYGYVMMNKPELKIREYEEYRAYYCGLCKALRARAGVRGQLALSYDMTFLALFLSALYEPETARVERRCAVHPVGRQKTVANDCIAYAADMSLLLARYKCRDDFADERKWTKEFYGKTIDGKVRRMDATYPRQTEKVRQCMEQLSALERQDEQNPDAPAACFGALLAEIFVMRKDEWETELRRFGFRLGQFVYVLDAYDDLESDEKKGCYNPLRSMRQDADFDDIVKQLLTLYASEFAAVFERLPILQNAEILRNIIYSGVFLKYETVRKRRSERTERQHERSL